MAISRTKPFIAVLLHDRSPTSVRGASRKPYPCWAGNGRPNASQAPFEDGGRGPRAWLARPTGRVTVLVGDGSFLINAGELVTLVQERAQITVVLLDNNGYQVIRRLQELGKPNEFYEFAAGHSSLVTDEQIRQMEAQLDFAHRHVGTPAPL